MTACELPHDAWVLHGDALEALSALPDNFVDCVVTSPPYWGLRDYGVAGQIGLEPTLNEFLDRLLAVFAEVYRVLKPSGTCWVNMGDSYASSWPCQRRNVIGSGPLPDGTRTARPARLPQGLRDKSLIGQPWRLALAMQDAGWILRSDVVWAKPSPMPESCKDRPTRAHEYVFLLTKSPKYWYDAQAIAEPCVYTPETWPEVAGFAHGPGSHTAVDHTRSAGLSTKYDNRNSFRRSSSKRAVAIPGHSMGTHRPNRKDTPVRPTRNARTVWEISTKPYAEAHFAAFPEELPRRCIRAGCPVGGVVLDPFAGSGTTLAVAIKEGRQAVGVELNRDYISLAYRRLVGVQPPLLEVA